MSPYARPQIEWAGVAVRMSDGTVYAFELGGFITGEITVKHDIDEDLTSFGGFRRYVPTGRSEVHVELHGTGTHSVRFQQAADEHRPRPAIAEQQRELEAAEQAEGTDRGQI